MQISLALITLLIEQVFTGIVNFGEGDPCSPTQPCEPGFSCHPREGKCYKDPPAVDRPYVWLGNGPNNCTRKPSDCAFFNFEFNMTHKHGDGEWCDSGEKVRCLSPVAPPVPNPTPANEFRYLTYNVFERDFYISYDGQKERTCRIPRQIAKYLSELDAITFQENFMGGCWPDSVSSRDLLKQHGFPHTTDTIYGINRPENGGIYIASRWPILEEDSHVYQHFCDDNFDQFAAKGVMYAKVQKMVNGQSRIYHLTGTHLQAGCDSEIRVNQSMEQREFLDNKTIPANEPIFMGGDFNTALFNNPDGMQDILNALRASVPMVVGKQDATSDPRINDIHNDSTSTQTPSWLDHVFLANDNLQPVNATMEAIVLTADKYFNICWCEQCILLEEYVYPDDPRCPLVRNVSHLSDHLPAMATFIFN